MPTTLGYHIVIAGYGLWLPGDERGHWSDAWDEQLGYIEPHTLHAGDPVRQRMAQERMKSAPARLSPVMIDVVIDVLGACAAASPWSIASASIEPTHTHLQLTYTERDIDNTVKWFKDRLTKEIHRRTSHVGPVWCKGRWRSFIFDESIWNNVKAYIENHNIRRGIGPRPYPFLK